MLIRGLQYQSSAFVFTLLKIFLFFFSYKFVPDIKKRHLTIMNSKIGFKHYSSNPETCFRGFSSICGFSGHLAEFEIVNMNSKNVLTIIDTNRG